MRALTVTAAIAATFLCASTAMAQDSFSPKGTWSEPNFDSGSGISEINNRTSGLVSTTPSRLTRSREEMNLGRNPSWAANPTPTQLRNETERALRDGGFRCTIAELDMVAQLQDGTPLVEVACEESAGLVIANTYPIQFNDCFDLADGAGAVGPCRLPRNVAMIEASDENN